MKKTVIHKFIPKKLVIIINKKSLILLNHLIGLKLTYTMSRDKFILAVLATSPDYQYTPVQLQKIFFLLDRNLDNQVKYTPHFNFIPYHYGPFDKGVYEDLNELELEGLVEIKYTGFNNLKNYHLTKEGSILGEKELENIDKKYVDYIKRVNDFVRGLSFEQLIKAIYKEYPDMKVNSIFFQ